MSVRVCKEGSGRGKDHSLTHERNERETAPKRLLPRPSISGIKKIVCEADRLLIPFYFILFWALSLASVTFISFIFCSVIYAYDFPGPGEWFLSRGYFVMTFCKQPFFSLPL